MAEDRPRAGIGRRGLAAAGAGLLGLAEARAAGPGVGHVEALRGRATAEAARGQRRDLAPPMPVFDGDLVATAAESRLTLRLGAALEIRLGADVRLRIDRFLPRIGGTLVLERGAMLLDRQETPDPPGVAVKTPFGLLAVRGTRVWGGPSNGVFGVFVERGSVLVLGGDQAVELLPGQGTDLRAPGAVPTDPVRWGRPRIEAAIATIS